MCDLCILERRTHVYHDDGIMRVLDCETCLTPMAVLKRHDRYPTHEEALKMIALTSALFGEGALDFEMRTIPEHFHFHIRRIP